MKNAVYVYIALKKSVPDFKIPIILKDSRCVFEAVSFLLCLSL